MQFMSSDRRQNEEENKGEDLNDSEEYFDARSFKS
jgi:hypothetical protein